MTPIYALLSDLALASAASSHLKTSCINTACSAVRVAITNPPANIWDANVISELNTFLTRLNSQESNSTNATKVVVFSSNTPGFFGGPIDLNLFAEPPNSPVNSTRVLEQYYANLDLLLSTPVIFIAEINGRAWGAGDEHLLRMDMRFAGPEAQLGAPEAAVGLLHVGGMQPLSRLIGPGLTAEYMLSAAQVSGQEAARVGWVNSAWPTKELLRNHVDRLAKRIALFHVEALRATKASIAELAAGKDIFARDQARFSELGALHFVQQNIGKILKVSRNLSLEFELNNNDNIVKALY